VTSGRNTFTAWPTLDRRTHGGRGGNLPGTSASAVSPLIQEGGLRRERGLKLAAAKIGLIVLDGKRRRLKTVVPLVESPRA
jgi:hypothetical protein